MARTFVLRDFSIEGIQVSLERLAERRPTEVVIPGIPAGRTQGQVFRDIVRDGLASVDKAIALVDLPNVNVGFELGFALGLGKPLALACAASRVPKWLGEPPLRGYLTVTGTDLGALERLVVSGEHIVPPKASSIGSDVLFLCPRRGEGLALHSIVRAERSSWRRQKDGGFDLHEIPELLDGVGTVVWTLVPPVAGAEERDGSENTACGIVAGMALGWKRELRVLRHGDFRSAIDVVQWEHRFRGSDEFRELCARIADPTWSESSETETPFASAVRQGGEPVRRPWRERLWRWGERRRWPLLLAGIGALVLVVATKPLWSPSSKALTIPSVLEAGRTRSTLDLEPMGDARGELVFPEAVLVKLTLSVDPSFRGVVSVREIDAVVEEFVAGVVPELDYERETGRELVGTKVVELALDEDGRVRSSLTEGQTLVLRAGEDLLEELDVYLRPKRTGVYRVHLEIGYSADGVDGKWSSEAIRIYHVE